MKKSRFTENQIIGVSLLHRSDLFLGLIGLSTFALQISGGSANEVRSMDFVSDSLYSERWVKCFTVADHFNHESVEIAVDFDILGE